MLGMEILKEAILSVVGLALFVVLTVLLVLFWDLALMLLIFVTALFALLIFLTLITKPFEGLGTDIMRIIKKDLFSSKRS